MNKNILGILKTERLVGLFLDFLSMAILSLHTRYIFTNFKSTLIIRVLEYWVKLILFF